MEEQINPLYKLMIVYRFCKFEPYSSSVTFLRILGSSHGMRNETDFRLHWLHSSAQCSTLFLGRVRNTSLVGKQKIPENALLLVY